MLQGVAFQQFHGEKSLPLVLADVVDGADVRVIQGGRGPRLPLEALQRLPVAGQLLGEKLQRHAAAQARVLGLVHHTHPPAPELLEDTIVGDRLPDHTDGRPGARRPS